MQRRQISPQEIQRQQLVEVDRLLSATGDQFLPARVKALNKAAAFLDRAYDPASQTVRPEFQNPGLPLAWYYAGLAYDELSKPEDAWRCFKAADSNKALDPEEKNQAFYSSMPDRFVERRLEGNKPQGFKDMLADPRGLPGIRGRPALRVEDVAPMPDAMAHPEDKAAKAVKTPPALTEVLLRGRNFLVQGKLNEALSEFYTIREEEFEALEDRHKYAFANSFSKTLFEAAASEGNTKEKRHLIGVARDFGDFMANREGEGKDAEILKAQGHHIEAVAYGYLGLYGKSVAEAEEAYKLSAISAGAKKLHAVAAGQLALSLRKQAGDKLEGTLKHSIADLYKESTRLFENNGVLWNNRAVFECIHGTKDAALEYLDRAADEADKTPKKGGIYHSMREKQTIQANYSLLTGEQEIIVSPSKENAEVAEPLLAERLVIGNGTKPAPPPSEVRRAPRAAPPSEVRRAPRAAPPSEVRRSPEVAPPPSEVRRSPEVAPPPREVRRAPEAARPAISTLAPPSNLVEIIPAVGDEDVELHVTPERLAEYKVVRAEILSDRLGRDLLPNDPEVTLNADGERWLKSFAVGVWYSQQAKKMEGRAAASGSRRGRRTSEIAAVECWTNAGEQFQLLCEDGRLTNEAGLHWRWGEALIGSGQRRQAMGVLRLTEDAIKTRYGTDLKDPTVTDDVVHQARKDYAETMSQMAQLYVRAPQKPSLRPGRTKPVVEAYKKLHEARDTLRCAFGKNALYPPGYYEAEAEVAQADKHMARDLKAVAAVAGLPWEAVRWAVNTPLGGHLRAKPTRGIVRGYEMCVEAILLDAAMASQMKYGLVPEGLEDKIRAFHSKDWVGAEDRLRRMMVSRGLLKAGFNLASLPPGEDILPPDLHQGGRVDFRYYAEAAAERAFGEYERDGRRWLKGRSERHRAVHQNEALASIRILETLGEKELAERLKQRLQGPGIL